MTTRLFNDLIGWIAIVGYALVVGIVYSLTW
jgi:hypothetical protein